MRRYTGTIQIDAVNFWAWVQDYTKDSDTLYETAHGSILPVCFNNPFSPNDLLLFVKNSKKQVFIPYADFWSWVIEEWSPNPADEIEFNTPVWDKSGLGINIEFINIEFAAGTISPRMWGEKPSWMKK
jgi:hypothetical protein